MRAFASFVDDHAFFRDGTGQRIKLQFQGGAAECEANLQRLAQALAGKAPAFVGGHLPGVITPMAQLEVATVR